MLHSGRLAGGRTGLTLDAFQGLYRDELVDAGGRSWAAVADLDGPNPLGSIAQFARECRRIKESIVSMQEDLAKSEPSPSARPVYRVIDPKPGTTQWVARSAAERAHDWVTNALNRELTDRGLVVRYDRQRDLVVSNKARDILLFEVKSSSSSQDVYTGIGQLMYHGRADDPKTKLVLVVPKPLAGGVEERARRLGFDILTYERRRHDVVFEPQALARVLGKARG